MALRERAAGAGLEGLLKPYGSRLVAELDHDRGTPTVERAPYIQTAVIVPFESRLHV